jgi:hypothetical protein
MCYYALLCDNLLLFVTMCCYAWLSVSMCENVLHVTVFLCVIMYCDLLLCVAMCCYWDYVLLCAAMWQSVAICENVLLCVTTRFNVRECVACDCVSLCDNVLWFADNVLWFSRTCDDVLLLGLCVTMRCYMTICCYLWQCVAIYAWLSVSMSENVLHVTVFLCVITCCDLLQCVTMCCYCDYV